MKCPVQQNTSWRKSTVKQYCPKYDKQFLYGNFYTTRFAWMRLALHFCDDSEEARQERKAAGKKHVECES